MLNLAAKVKRWWAPRPASRADSSTAFAVECICGQVVEGTRQPGAQLVPCPKCGSRLFVFPQSPWPLVSGVRPRVRAADGPAPVGVPTAALVLVAGATLAVVCLILWLALPRPDPDDEAARAPEPAGPHLRAARSALAQGKFQTALHELEVVRAAQEGRPPPLAQRRAVAHLERQARLLADLLDVPLGDLLRNAGELPQQEWELVFDRRYRGKAVVFDAEVSRDAAGKPRLEWLLRVGGEDARLDVADLGLFKHLRLDQPTRLIFGVRLEGVGRDPAGAWVVRFRPDSAVLLTDRPTVEVVCPALRPDAELPEVLKRQERWLAELP